MSISDNIETIILRFRDLVCTDTITHHKDILSEKGYVWWGWWAKVQETIPPTAFNILQKIISDKRELNLYLFDSGTLKFYMAKCNKIEYNTDSTELKSPESNCTPQYYREQKYLAWFKFTAIETQVESILSEYSYIDIDELFQSVVSPFKSFNNKVIFSLNELQEQQRTIWFLRNKKPTDLTHEIHSYSLNSSGLGNVDTQFRVLTTYEMLWLSDTHFSNEHHAFTCTSTEDNTLGSKLERRLKSLNMTPCAVIISGDLTFKATKDEFEMVEKFIGYLNSIYSLSSPLYSLCPGNHDLSFSDSPDKAESEIIKTYPEAKKNYLDFYRKLYGFAPTEELYSIRRFLTPDLMPIEIISINSCYLQQTKGKFQGLGYVGNNQIDKLKRELALTDSASPFRILVMHHHLIPVIYKEEAEYNKVYSLTLDAEAVVQFILDCNINLVLHGHNHKDFYSEVIRKCTSENIKKKFYIVGLGSAGVKKSELSDGRTNMFSTIEFKKDNITIRGYQIFASGEDGKNIFEHIIPTREDF